MSPGGENEALAGDAMKPVGGEAGTTWAVNLLITYCVPSFYIRSYSLPPAYKMLFFPVTVVKLGFREVK